VRNTFEVLALSGLAYKSASDPPLLLLTDLGQLAFGFLGLLAGIPSVANESNIHLVAHHQALALGAIPEIRAIWMLMRACDDRLSNEELNRAMSALASFSDIADVTRAVRDSRSTGHPEAIGDRIYENEKYGTDKATDQRKAINPLFLLCGGGGTIIDLGGADGFRMLRPASIPSIDISCESASFIPAHDTSAASVLALSRAGRVQPSCWDAVN
jgi:hypothetical protein